MRRKTYLKIINALRAGINSKRGIQDYSGLSWGSCSPVINHLLSQRVIVAHDGNEYGKPSKGRRTKFFQFNKKQFLLMGMEIEPTGINCCLTTLGNEYLGSYSTKFNHTGNFNSIQARISQAFLDCKQNLKVETDNIFGISFSLPGAIDVENKLWLYTSRITDINRLNFNQLDSSNAIPNNIYLQHDIHAQAFSVIPSSELEDQDYVFIHIGQGMGMSANMEGILYGHRGFAGEIGHLPYPGADRDIICTCGNRNCLETVLNAHKILKFVNHKYSKDFTDLNEVNDTDILRDVTNEYVLPPLTFLSVVVSNIFDPRRIIIGGSVLEPFYKFLITGFEKQLRENAWINGPEEICWYKSSDIDGAFGAVLHSSDRIIEDFINQIDLDH